MSTWLYGSLENWLIYNVTQGARIQGPCAIEPHGEMSDAGS
jgi:hypothetical protein